MQPPPGWFFYSAGLGLRNVSLKATDFQLVSSEEKRKLFHKHEAARTYQTFLGIYIQKSVEVLCPSVAQHFEARPGSLDDLAMRVWLHPSLRGKPINGYICLSYCWDLERFPRSQEDPYRLPVSDNLFNALGSLAMTRGGLGIWIDQLCIDQYNREEKAISITAMDVLYKCADTVVVYLSDIEIPLGHQQFFESKFGERWWKDETGYLNLSKRPSYAEEFPVLRRFFENLNRSRYFTRAWCIHESSLAERIVVYVPCQAEPGEHADTKLLCLDMDFVRWVSALAAEVPRARDTLTHDLLRGSGIRTMSFMRHDFSEPMPDPAEMLVWQRKQPTTWLSTTAQIFEAGAGGDPMVPEKERALDAISDRITIVLNLLGAGLRLKASSRGLLDEKMAIKCLTVLALAADDPHVLCSLGEHFQFGNSQNQLSWIRRPSEIDLVTKNDQSLPIPTMMPYFSKQIHFDPSDELHWIAIDGFAAPQPQVPQEHYLMLAKHLVNECRLLGLGRPPPLFPGERDRAADYVGKDDILSRVMLHSIDSLSSWGVGPDFLFWSGLTFLGWTRGIFEMTLACILQAGPIWLLQTAHKCSFAPLQRALPHFEQIVSDDAFDIIYLLDTVWKQSESGRHSVNILLSFACWMVYVGCLNPHNQAAKEYRPALYPMGPNDSSHALVYIRGDCLLQVILPCALNDDEYSTLHRIWLLAAEDDPWYDKMKRGMGVKWILRAKAILFTDVAADDMEYSKGSAADGKPGWRLRDGIKVHAPREDISRQFAEVTGQFLFQDEAAKRRAEQAAKAAERDAKIAPLMQSALGESSTTKIEPHATLSSQVEDKRADENTVSDELEPAMANMTLTDHDL